MRREARWHRYADQAPAFPLLAVVAGMMYSLQSGLNAQLARGVGGPAPAAFTSFLVGTVLLAAVTLRVTGVSGLLTAWRGQPLTLLLGGGLLGVATMMIVIVLIPRIGTAVVVCFLVAGQVIAALAQDQYAWFGGLVREATPGRIAGAALVVIGAAMVRLL